MGITIQPRCGGVTYEPSIWYKKQAIAIYQLDMIPQTEICEMFDIHYCTLFKWLKKFSIPTSTKSKKIKEKETGLKRCCECKQWLSFDEFYNRTFRGPCKSCYKIRNDIKRKRAIFYLGNKCTRCGLENLPMCCYSFHHRNPKEKEHEPAHYARLDDWDKVKKELDKCDLVCSNCHFITHHGALTAKEVT